ncbi:NAD(P)-dependent oxidoreductase [Leuconostoc mesenteroides]|nr:NAD(P)-dependent oxidoreductase [Leuconostoc mesenteroides]
MTDMAFDKNWFDALPNLKLIARRGVGYDNIPVESATKHGVWVTNTPGANAIAVAELAVTLILTVLRKVNQATNSVQKGEALTYPASLMGHNLSGKIIGLIGYGQIAQNLEKILHGFGAHVLVYSRTKRETLYGQFVSYDTLLEQSDIISLHIPATPETSGILNHEAFSKMKTNAILINTARAALVYEEALVEAINTGKIAGAGLDTTSYETIKTAIPLLNHDQIVITPHIGANTVESEYLTAEKVVASVLDFFNNQKPIYRLN